MNRTKALKVLVGVRERRGLAMDEAVQAALRREDEARAGVEAANDALAGVLAAEAQERNKLQRLTDPGQTFDINMLMLREHAADAMKGKVAKQQVEVDRCGSVLAERGQDVRARRADVSRNRQKIESLKGDIAKMHAARQREDDDQQDEEAEETAIARLIQARARPEESEDW
jgi:hypothetical protein